MYRRVAGPMLLAVGVWGGMALAAAASDMVTKMAMDDLVAGKTRWMPPVLPFPGWLLFLVVFFAVRMCALRGGTRRECITVGLSPLVLGAVIYGFLLITYGGLSALATVAGIMTAVMQGKLTIGTTIAARGLMGHLLNLAGTCIAATWLYLSVGRTCPASASATQLVP